ncbi:hypothetical protein L4X63_06465 [Geomonas sp. Red32]|uniref:hypothetical protein n=1 Tax=Geomonas sp. Red32 TaxID=2912856 RepID=UPI00202CC39B|nr:hypothetical protein [Geomonas sp. Red32]MCM0081227.1 hypothetical protein [Geomonas sp. Red32]
MSNFTVDALFRHVLVFRGALASAAAKGVSLPTLDDFPRGACADASLLLAKHLQEKGWGNAFLVVGERRGERHAWLQLGDVTIDITADQFEDQPCGVIVSAESRWHSAFEAHASGVADFCLYEPASATALANAYEAIANSMTVPAVGDANGTMI